MSIIEDYDVVLDVSSLQQFAEAGWPLYVKRSSDQKVNKIIDSNLEFGGKIVSILGLYVSYYPQQLKVRASVNCEPLGQGKELFDQQAVSFDPWFGQTSSYQRSEVRHLFFSKKKADITRRC